LTGKWRVVLSSDEAVTRTFRLESKLDKVLREEAEEKGISVNNLANQIFTRFALSERYFGKGQSITFAPQTIDLFISKISDEDIEEAGEISGSMRPRDRLLLRGRRLDFDSVAWYIEDILGGYNDWFICDHYEREDEHLFHLRHHYDPKWSIFLMKYIEAMFQNVLDSNVDVTKTDDTVTIRVRKPVKTK
jgi:hypothetical protein